MSGERKAIEVNWNTRRKVSRPLREVMDATATDDERTEAAIRFFVTLGMENDPSCGYLLLAAMKILSSSADLQGYHPLSAHFKEIDRIMDALLATKPAVASPRLQ